MSQGVRSPFNHINCGAAKGWCPIVAASDLSLLQMRLGGGLCIFLGGCSDLLY